MFKLPLPARAKIFLSIVLLLALTPSLNRATAAQKRQVTLARPEHSLSSAQGWPSLPAAGVPTDQIILKFRASATPDNWRTPSASEHLQRLSAAAGVQLTYFRQMSGDAHVLRLPQRLPLLEVQQISARLMRLAEVAYAAPDALLQPLLAPNDPRYPEQWHYSGAYGINAPAAWDITVGAANIIVAVIDTGITNHADLRGRTVPGYDFITNVLAANDGNARDPDPSDPGDWVSANECGYPHPPYPSSWHGTHVAGTIGAVSNNGLGVAGINWVSKILPVRVLGKCGGYTSDIVDGMRWAAGLPVSGVPSNPYPARVLNLSLGGSGVCEPTFQNAINEIIAAGATVVVAAGNDNADVSGHEPANCKGVITVAATNRNGDKASYSNFGALVEISAPGGEQMEANDPNAVLSTLDSGKTTPAGDTYGTYAGTSMAAPHVAGAASLLLSLSPALSPSQVQQILQGTGSPFPPSSTCNSSICGGGIVNAGAALAVLPRVTALSPSGVKPGSASFELKVYGANFTPNSTVRWNGSPRTTAFINSGELRATIPASDVSSPGVTHITVITPHPSYGNLITAERLFVAGSFLNLPLIMRETSPPPSGTPTPTPAPTSTPTPSSWVTILSEDFEGDFPTGVWDVFDNDGLTNGEYYWAKRPCRAYLGSSSGWATGGGANGSGLGCGANYPDNADAWMVYGPFSLQGATAAELTFKLWLNSEYTFDSLCRLASIDGTSFFGSCTLGSGAWIDRILDLSDVYTLGDLRGQPQVWIALTFESNSSNNSAEGAYIDNLMLRKCTSPGGCVGSTALALVVEGGQVVERPAMLRRP